MEYVLVGFAVVVIIAAGAGLIVARGRREAAPFAPEPGTPLGDTREHADGDAERSGGSGRPARTAGALSVPDPDPSRRPTGGGGYTRDPVGGEAEGSQTR